ncbi:HAD-IC family P-type ATPase [candidate division WWE3 bacterium]|nr:HAD-IC family P-type ATPase [candidate division WWE3 bacterium]
MLSVSEYTTLTVDDLLSKYSLSNEKGLTDDQVIVQRQEHGLNQITSKQTLWWEILKRQFSSPFVYILIVCALLLAIIGEPIDAVMITLFILLNTTLSFYQEFQSEKTIQLLKGIIYTRARVRRNGVEQIIDSKDLVPGDIVIVENGDVIPADLRFIETTSLMINESILSGESAPVPRHDKPLIKAATEFNEAENIGFSGTTVVSGKAMGVVIGTGEQTAIGEISNLVEKTHGSSGFEQNLSKLSTFILWMVIVTLILLYISNIFIKGPDANPFELLIFSITLAVGVIPEALPVVTTFALSRGARELADKKVVVKRLSAIEDLGSIDILCTDKTGTITQNTLTVDSLYEEPDQDPLFLACLASPFGNETSKQPNNSFDLALLNRAPQSFTDTKSQYTFVGEVPFDPERRRNIVSVKKGKTQIMIVRGAPESILPLCISCKQSEQEISNWMNQQGRDGKRIIAVATKEIPLHTADDSLLEYEKDLIFAGLISFIDPLKDSTISAVNHAKQLNVGIKMITGDNAEVAGAVGKKIGIVDDPEAVITGTELDKLTHAEQEEAVEKYFVFARISPQQKYRIIELLQNNHEVGFLGEGINDAPALKLANVSLVVQDASDIAREASDIVLLESGLDVIVMGIQEGRNVFANTVKYIKATLASNFGNFFAVASATYFINFLPMLPLQILLVNLLSDFPMISIATDRNDLDQIKMPKRYHMGEIAKQALILGVVSTSFDLLVFRLFVSSGPQVLQTNWLISSILTELVFLFSIRTNRFFLHTVAPSFPIISLSLGAIIATLVIPFTSLGRQLFSLTPPTQSNFITIGLVVLVYFISTETIKLIGYKTGFFSEK